jgi:hypothetical protein
MKTLIALACIGTLVVTTAPVAQAIITGVLLVTVILPSSKPTSRRVEKLSDIDY